jgi:excisionase family DNA binding protein
MATEESGSLWTIAEAASYLQIPTSSVYKMTARKARVRIPHIRISGRLRFRKAHLDSWLELLTVSNLDVLKRMQTATRRLIGHDSQTDDRQR